MRDLINLIESLTPPSELYHGTSMAAWESIKASNTFEAGDHRDELAISFTDDWSVAERFAKRTCHYGEEGVILTIDTSRLMQRYRLEPYHDAGVIMDEAEWRVLGDKIEGFADMVVDIEEVFY